MPLFELIGVGCRRLASHFERVTQEKRAQEAVPPRARPYRTLCPKCGAQVVTEELRSGGCYVCGWRPRETDGTA